MSDHWKTLARLLGAPGATDPPKPKPIAKPAAAKPAAREAESSAPQPAAAEREEPAPPAKESPAQADAAAPDDDDLFSGFGKPRSPSRREPQESESRPAAAVTRESSPPESSPRESSPPAPAAGSLFSEPVRSEGPSSWDELVDRLGIPAAPSPSPRLADSEPLDAPAAKHDRSPKQDRERSQRSAPKAAGGGFGLGLVPEPEGAIPEPAPAKPVAAEPVAPQAARSEPTERDPLAELGQEGWGAPRRGRAPSTREETPARQQAPEGRAVNEEREQRPSRSREERDDRGERRGERVRREPGTRGADESAGEGSTAEESTRGASARGEEPSGRPPRRGRRRGQRQRMTEPSGDWSEDQTAQGSRAKSSFELDDEDEDRVVGFAEPDVDDDFGSSLLSDEDAASSAGEEGEDGEQPPRRRRRRGRRRRGGGSEAGAEPAARSAGESGPERETPSGRDSGRDDRATAARTGGRAIEAEFDDDHEDDDEAVALRRSRRGRRRRSSVPQLDAGAGEDSPQSSNYGIDTDDSDDEDVVLQNTQRNIPTWTDAVSLLVMPNMESRKRDPQRGGGGGGGRGRGRRRD